MPPGAGQVNSPRHGTFPMPEDLDAYTFRIESDEYAVLSYGVAVEEQGPDGAVDGLTPAERGVLELVLRGLSIAAVARHRGTSPRTVAHQLTSIYQRLGVRSRRELRARLQAGGARP